VNGEATALFRAVNERIVELGAASSGTIDFFCECSDERCTRVLSLTLDEFDAIRRDPHVHVVLPGHEDAEDVVGRTGEYILIRPVAIQVQSHVAA
jgi:hypothetical protein